MSKKKLRAIVLTADKFEDMEVYVPIFRLQEEDIEVDVAAPTMDEIEGEHGHTLQPDIIIDKVNPDNYDLSGNDKTVEEIMPSFH